jgi:NADH-quinone oxidoreductase chain G
MIEFIINDKTIKTNEGTNILRAALDNSIEIPHFCYHHGIGIEGSCRLCLVEIKDQPKLVISCATEAKNGLVVYTHSPRVIKARKGVLEFLLTNHPLDCPICDKGGECPLQDFTFKYGPNTSRFIEEKIKGVKHEILGEHIIFDSERCILCTRCVRFGRDVVGYQELGRLYRGAHTKIALTGNTPLRSDFSGCLADICPVGALTTREFRFKARPWELTKTNTSCMICSVGCSIEAWTKNKNISRFTPRYNESINSYWMCDKGRFQKNTQDDPDRLMAPLLKHGSDYREISFEQARVLIVNKLNDIYKRSGVGSISFLINDNITNEEFDAIYEISKMYESLPILFNLNETANNFFYKTYINNFFATYDNDFKNSDAIIIIGEDIWINHPIFALRLRYHIKNNKKIYALYDKEYFYKDFNQIKINTHKEFLDNINKIIQENTNKNIILGISENFINADNVDIFYDLLEKFKNIKIIPLTKTSNTYLFSKKTNSKIPKKTEAVIVYPDIKSKAVLDNYEILSRAWKVSFAYKTSGINLKSDLIIPIDRIFEKEGTFRNILGLPINVEQPNGIKVLDMTNKVFFNGLLDLIQKTTNVSKKSAMFNL